jgi:shikimate kinase
MRIYLVGFMGSGKTTVGRVLAERLDVPFFDIDELVEDAESSAIREIFASHGEPYFRRRERDFLRMTRHLEKGVIATGGGTFTFEDNIEFVQRSGISIHLAVPYELCLARVSESSAERPMFHDERALLRLFKARASFYRRSDLTVEIHESETPREIAERMIQLMPPEVRRSLLPSRGVST